LGPRFAREDGIAIRFGFRKVRDVLLGVGNAHHVVVDAIDGLPAVSEENVRDIVHRAHREFRDGWRVKDKRQNFVGKEKRGFCGVLLWADTSTDLQELGHKTLQYLDNGVPTELQIPQNISQTCKGVKKAVRHTVKLDLYIVTFCSMAKQPPRSTFPVL